MKVTVKDQGVARMLKNAPRQIARANRSAVHTIAAIVIRELKTYPAPPSGSKYRRTRTLGRSWQSKVEVRGAIVRATITSSGRRAPYNRHVQDEHRQAKHMSHWRNTMQATARRNTKGSQAIWRTQLQAHVGK